MCKCPTYELPILPFGIPTSSPLAKSSVYGKFFS
jgi:hypothetical protein